jgi:NAD(P)-dependent dehydrogenase (short-subunit alcohol dehydrogenase family)
MKLADKTVLVTGASRGLGRALALEAARRGARVHAGTRGPAAGDDPRLKWIHLDVTNPEQIRRAAAEIGSLDVLVNNAGIANHDDLADPAVTQRHLAVNLLGPLAVTQAFLPHLKRARGAIVNHLSVAAVAAMPMLPAYSVSKAALLNMTQSLRALLARDGVSVHAVLLGPIDTDMSRDLPVAKAAPDATARLILDGLERGDEDIFPDPMSSALAPGWNAGVAKALEREFRAYAPGAQTAPLRP